MKKISSRALAFTMHSIVSLSSFPNGIVIPYLIAGTYFSALNQIDEYQKTRKSALVVLQWSEKIREWNFKADVDFAEIRSLPPQMFGCLTQNPLDILQKRKVHLEDGARTVTCLEDVASSMMPPEKKPITFSELSDFGQPIWGMFCGSIAAVLIKLLSRPKLQPKKPGGPSHDSR